MSGFSTLNRLLGKKNKNAVKSSFSSSNLTLDTSSQYNKIVPLADFNNLPFEQTFRITVFLPRQQLYVARVGAKTKLSELKILVCEDKLLEKEKYEFKHPADNMVIFDDTLTIGEVGLKEIQLTNKNTIQLGNNRNVAKAYNSTAQILSSPHSSSLYSSSVSLNSCESSSTVTSDKRQSIPIPPVRKKRAAPRPPSQFIAQDSLNNNNDSKQRPFHASSPNIPKESECSVPVEEEDNKPNACIGTRPTSLYASSTNDIYEEYVFPKPTPRKRLSSTVSNSKRKPAPRPPLIVKPNELVTEVNSCNNDIIDSKDDGIPKEDQPYRDQNEEPYRKLFDQPTEKIVRESDDEYINIYDVKSAQAFSQKSPNNDDIGKNLETTKMNASNVNKSSNQEQSEICSTQLEPHVSDKFISNDGLVNEMQTNEPVNDSRELSLNDREKSVINTEQNDTQNGDIVRPQECLRNAAHQTDIVAKSKDVDVCLATDRKESSASKEQNSTQDGNIISPQECLIDAAHQNDIDIIKSKDVDVCSVTNRKECSVSIEENTQDNDSICHKQMLIDQVQQNDIDTNSTNVAIGSMNNEKESRFEPHCDTSSEDKQILNESQKIAQQNKHISSQITTQVKEDETEKSRHEYETSQSPEWTYRLPVPKDFADVDDSIRQGTISDTHFNYSNTHESDTIISDSNSSTQVSDFIIEPIFKQRVLLDESLHSSNSNDSLRNELDSPHFNETTTSDMEDGYKGTSMRRVQKLNDFQNQETIFAKKQSIENLKDKAVEDEKNRVKDNFVTESLQSVQVLKNILNSSKSPLTDHEHKNEEKPSSKFKYQGPPAINLTTWSERPKIKVQIKSDTDYKFGGVYAKKDEPTYETNTKVEADKPKRPILLQAGKTNFYQNFSMPKSEKRLTISNIPMERIKDVPIVKGLVIKATTPNEMVKEEKTMYNKRISTKTLTESAKHSSKADTESEISHVVLRKTGLKEQIMAEEKRTNTVSTLDKTIDNQFQIIRSVSVNLPPQPPKPPIIRDVVLKKKPSPQVDDRSQFLNSIKNFQRENLKKISY